MDPPAFTQTGLLGHFETAKGVLSPFVYAMFVWLALRRAGECIFEQVPAAHRPPSLYREVIMDFSAMAVYHIGVGDYPGVRDTKCQYDLLALMSVYHVLNSYFWFMRLPAGNRDFKFWAFILSVFLTITATIVVILVYSPFIHASSLAERRRWEWLVVQMFGWSRGLWPALFANLFLMTGHLPFLVYQLSAALPWLLTWPLTGYAGITQEISRFQADVSAATLPKPLLLVMLLWPIQLYLMGAAWVFSQLQACIEGSVMHLRHRESDSGASDDSGRGSGSKTATATAADSASASAGGDVKNKKKNQ